MTTIYSHVFLFSCNLDGDQGFGTREFWSFGVLVSFLVSDSCGIDNDVRLIEQAVQSWEYKRN